MGRSGSGSISQSSSEALSGSGLFLWASSIFEGFLAVWNFFFGHTLDARATENEPYLYVGHLFWDDWDVPLVRSGWFPLSSPSQREIFTQVNDRGVRYGGYQVRASHALLALLVLFAKAIFKGSNPMFLLGFKCRFIHFGGSSSSGRRLLILLNLCRTPMFFVVEELVGCRAVGNSSALNTLSHWGVDMVRYRVRERNKDGDSWKEGDVSC